MDIKKEIKVIVAREGTTLTAVAGKLYKTKSSRNALNLLSQKLRNNTVKFKEINDILDFLGYELKIFKK